MTSTRPVMDAIVDFVRTVEYDDLPAEVIGSVIDAMTDALGCGLAGAREPVAEALKRALEITEGTGSVLIGTRGTCSADAAALYNGAVIHALDFDDTNHPAYAHPSAHLLPVVLDAAGSGPTIPGRRAVTAYVAGLEVEARLGASLNLGHYLRGWHTTGTFGSLAATAAAAVLHRLETRETRTALGVAASLASGLRVNFGTMTKPFHAGLAARDGIQAMRLARAGFTASPDALDGTFGFFHTFAGGQAGEESDLSSWSGLGSRWETQSAYGLALKPYPACGATHPAIEAALLVREELAGAEISRVVVETTRHWDRVLIHPAPTTGLEAKFSLQFCVAAALATGRVTLQTFTDTAVRDPMVEQVRRRIEVAVHPELADNTEWAAEVTVHTRDGRVLVRRIELAKGKRDRRLDKGELETKFVSCATPTLTAARAADAFGVVQGLAELDDVGVLADIVHP